MVFSKAKGMGEKGKVFERAMFAGMGWPEFRHVYIHASIYTHTHKHTHIVIVWMRMAPIGLIYLNAWFPELLGKD